MSWDINTPNTGTALANMSPDSVRILWQKMVDVFDQSEDFFAPFEGDNKKSPVRVINDTAVGKGLKFRITARAGYFGKGKSGDDLFENSTDYEPDLISSNEVDADFLRNATSITQRTDEFLGTQNEIRNGQAEELGKWMGREKSARLGMLYRLRGGSQNLLIGGGKSNQDLLKTADGLVYADLLYMGQALKPLGGTPAEVGTIRGVKIYKYLMLGTTPGLFSLKADSDYQAKLRDAMPREKWDENPLWAGGYAEIDGHTIREFNPIDNDGDAWVGSFWNPKAYLGAAINAGTAVFNVTGGGVNSGTRVDYFRFFENFAFEFLPADIFTPTYATAYFLIVNPKNAAVDPGKFGMYSYTTGNQGNYITVLNRLGPSNAGGMVSTLGSVIWNSGVWAGLHTNVHPVGSTIIQCNAFGVPFGDTIMTGSNSALRGYGSMRNKRSEWLIEGGFQMRTFITSVFGQALRKNVNGVIPGYVRLRHALNYPELGLPVVV